MKNHQFSLSIPITLGIVGHRDAIITERHRELLNNLFNDLHIRYPNSPLYCFSQLAEGADSDVAEIFLEAKDINDALIVPIPFNNDSYLKMFDDPAHLTRYKKLIGQAKRHFELTDCQVDDANRDILFRNGGKFIADSSVILIVLWDGQNNELVGGTADIVHYKETGSFTDDDVRNIYEKPAKILKLLCNRISKPLIDIRLTSKSLIQEIHDDQNIKKALDKIEQLNVKSLKTRESDVKKSLKYLIESKANISPEDQLLMSFYCQTDCLAIDNQIKYHRILRFLFSLGGAIILTFEIYKDNPNNPYALAIYIILVIIALTLSKLAGHKEFHMAFLESRVLAESLRVQFFWNLVGLKENAGDHILRIYKKEYDWIKYILNAIYGITYPEKKSWMPEQARRHWFGAQINYQSIAVKKFKRKRKTLNNTAKFALYFAPIFFIYVLLINSAWLINSKLSEFLPEVFKFKKELGISLSGLMLAIFALSKAYLEKRGYHQFINQRVLMLDIFSETAKRFDSVTGNNEMKIKSELFRQVGIEALIENGNWYLIYKDKEPGVEGIGG